jgi:aspartate/methionine/tyrosine aminotransferase
MACTKQGRKDGMSGEERTKRSIYMEWAKLHSHARFNLATSGLISVAISEFPVQASDLELTAPGEYGYPPLQQRMAQHNHVSEECVVAAAGTSMANHLAMAAVLNPGDEVLVEQPVYGPLLDVVEYLGARVKRLPRPFAANFALDPGDVAQALSRETRLMALSNLHNPSGALLSADVLRRIGEMALRAGAYVLVDEVYLEMLFDSGAPYSFAIGSEIAPADENPFIVTNSLTKVYGFSGLRCGWILAAAPVARRMWLLNDLYGANAAHPAERLSILAFDRLPEFRDRTRKLLRTNSVLLDAFLDSRADLECFRPVAGTVVFPRLRHGNPDVFFHLLREKYETSVVPGSFFEMPQHFRIGIGGETAPLKAGLERLGAALDEFGKL